MKKKKTTMMKVEMPRHNLEMIRDAVSTQIRLIDAYVNKSPEQVSRLEEYRNIWFDLYDIVGYSK